MDVKNTSINRVRTEKTFSQPEASHSLLLSGHIYINLFLVSAKI